MYIKVKICAYDDTLVPKTSHVNFKGQQLFPTPNLLVMLKVPKDSSHQ